MLEEIASDACLAGPSDWSWLHASGVSIGIAYASRLLLTPRKDSSKSWGG